MRTIEDILKEMKPLMGTGNPEERKKAGRVNKRTERTQTDRKRKNLCPDVVE